MKTLSTIILAIALAGCATQGTTTVSDLQPALHRGDRPQVIFVGTPAMRALPAQVIGDEPADLDGLS